MAKESPPPRSVASQLRDLLGQATQADVDEIDAEIAAKDEEIAKLRANRKMLAQAIGLEPEKKHWTQQRKPKPPKEPKAEEAKPSSDPKERRQIVLRHLRAVGSCSLDTLSAQTRISRFGPGALGAVLAHEWFHVSPENMVSLTDKGDKASVM